MTDGKPSWRDLNAYADGELPPSEAAAIARAVAEDSALASQVATLARLKATVQEHGDEALPAELLGLCRIAGTARSDTAVPVRRARVWIGAAAAALAFVLLAGALLIPLERQAAQPAWRDLALRLHATWAKADPSEATRASADALLASLSHLGQTAQVPDLSGARLTVGYVRPIAWDHGHGLHVGYRGTRGCRVSLIILPAEPGLPKTPVALGDDGDQQYAWRVGGLGYALLASGMDPQHFGMVLKTVLEASQKQAPVGPETRQALADSRAHSRPCAA